MPRYLVTVQDIYTVEVDAATEADAGTLALAVKDPVIDSHQVIQITQRGRTQRPTKILTIGIGQRLIRADGVRGSVGLDCPDRRVYTPSEPFKVDWEDGHSEYFTLELVPASWFEHGRPGEQTHDV
jgi:hypothetical protein